MDSSGKLLANFRISCLSRLSVSAILLDLESDSELPSIQPGQFAQIEIDGDNNVFLRRPFSIHFADHNHVQFLIQLVGPGTMALSRLREGDRLSAILPLGNGFDIIGTEHGHSLLVGGGIGVAPLFMLGIDIKKLGGSFTYLFGVRNVEQLYRLDAFSQLAPVAVSTQDGSFGETGLVTQNSVLKEGNFDRVFCCGPTAMMKAVAQIARDRGIPCQVSLEHKMACGIGACLCCVEDTRQGNVCICKEGPVFDIDRLKW